MALLETKQDNLPVQLTSFVGRGREVAEIKQLLTTTHLLTLTGSGGAGKTRLSLQVAAELVSIFPDGVWLVELAPLSDPTLVAQTIAQILSVQEELDQPLPHTLTNYLRSKALLLVLDNCEHLIEECARLAGTLLSQCPGLRMLATSREALSIPGETIFRVPSLSLPPLSVQTGPSLAQRLPQAEAGQLFVERVRSVAPGFEVTTQNALAIAQICHRLDGIPLALELAAARVKVLSVEQIVSRLDDRFKLLAGGSRIALPRQQTLRALIDWSYNLLPEPEKIVLARLSVFAGNFSLEAAEEVCAGNYRLDTGWGQVEAGEVLDLLAQLVNKSLVLAEQGRYRLLETIREYAQQKLAENGETEQIKGQHYGFYLALAEEADPLLQGPQQLEWLNRLEQEHDNLRAALAWGLEGGKDEGGRIKDETNSFHPSFLIPHPSERALRLAGVMWQFWQAHVHTHEGIRWLEAALAQTENQPGASLLWQARAVQGIGVLLSALDHDRSWAYQEENLRLRRLLDDKPGVIAALVNLGWVAFMLHLDMEKSNELAEEGLALGRALGDRSLIVTPLYLLSMVASVQDKLDQSLAMNEECLQIWTELGDQGSIASVLNQMGSTLVQKGDFEAATPLLEKGLALNLELDNMLGQSVSLINLSGVAGLQAAKYGPERARVGAKLQGAISKLMSFLGTKTPPFAQLATDKVIDIIKAQLDEASFDRAYAEGEVLTWDQAVELAQQIIRWQLPSSVAEPVGEPVTPPKPADAYPNGLSGREVEVLRLVAAGLTNQQIAEKLVLSHRTVEAHLRSIFAKLEVTSRSGATRFAIEQHLV